MKIIIIVIFFYLSFQCSSFSQDSLICFRVDTRTDDIRFFWKDDLGNQFYRFDTLEHWLKIQNKQLVFATNGGIFDMNFIPKGLYIESGKMLNNLDQNSGEGNFYMKPNGVFAISYDNKVKICKTEEFQNENVKFALQSGPMLLIDKEVNDMFNPISENRFIRNAVGIVNDYEAVFVFAIKDINLYELSMIMKEHGCTYALYLDGGISSVYYPAKKIFDSEANYGVIIGVIK